MGKGSSAPSYPDPVQTTKAQSKYAKDFALWNSSLQNVNQVTPYGNISYQLTSGAPTVNYDAYQKALDSYNNAMASVAANPQEPPNYLSGSDKESWNFKNGNASGGSFNAAKMTAPKLEDFTSQGGMPQWTSTINLSEEQQKILDQQQANQIKSGEIGANSLSQAQNAYANPFSYSGLPEVYGSGDLNAARSKAEEAIYSRLDPQFNRDYDALRTQLANQGIGQGSEAYNREMENFNKAKTDARMQAVLFGGQEADRLFGQSLTNRQQAISEYERQRNAPLNEYAALTGGVQVQNPQFQQYNYTGAQTPNYAQEVQNQYQSQLNAYNADVAGQNSLLGGLFGLGTSMLTGGAGSLFGLGGTATGALGAASRMGFR